MTTATLRAAIVLPALFIWLAIPGMSRAEEGPHHHLHHAIHELKEAKVELLEAKHDFGGHRERAIKAIDVAILQLDRLLVAAGEKYISPRVDAELYKKYDHHPHMQHAIHELREAHRQIKESRLDYGGIKEQALADINYAVEQIELALKFHDGKK
jgi:hypothetical protein